VQTEATIKNGQSNGTANIGYRRHRKKINRTNKKTLHRKLNKMSNTDPTKNQRRTQLDCTKRR
jgi:hypothetical protein